MSKAKPDNAKHVVTNKLQGDKPGMDPKRFGLKFDSDKDRWDLLPTDVMAIIRSSFQAPENLYIVRCENVNALTEEVVEDMIAYWNCRKTRKNNIEILSCSCLKIMQIGRNFNDDRFPWTQIEQVVKIYTYGARKYESWNWIKVDMDRYYSAFMRHFHAFRSGKIYDEESGFEHRMHALWNAIALLWFEMQKNG